jgi:T-complex protein 1 subunit theta
MMNVGGLPSLLKEGTKHLSGVEESCIRNIEASKQLYHIVRSSMGPNGMNKMVINQHDKLFVTNDAATIIRELDVVHPAAKMVVMAANMQEQECGDNTNLVVSLAGELLVQAESLIRMGLHPSEIIAGYTKAAEHAAELLEGLACHTCEDLRNVEEVTRCLKSAIASKQYGYEDMLSKVVAKACIQVLPKKAGKFMVDHVRVVKILGGGVLDTHVMKGFVLARDAVGTIKHVTSAKIAVFATGIDLAKTETKANVTLKSADELLNFAKDEEKHMEEVIKQISETGTKVVVAGGNIGELALHFIERYSMMALKVESKFQIRRLCQATGATPLVRLGAPIPEELGYCDVVSVDEIGSTKVTIFRQDTEDSGISTIIVRASTQNLVDDIERAIDDGVNVYKAMVKDGRFVAGAGATEIELARKIHAQGEASPGLDQYAIKKFAESLEVVPRTLAENAGHNATELISQLYAAHTAGKTNDGIDVETGSTINAAEADILDLLASKASAIKLASDAATTILRIDQIIMARAAGGPKPPAMGARDSS